MRTFRFLSLMILLLTCQLMGAQDTSSQVINRVITIDQQGSPVILLGDTLFRVRSSYGSFTPQERAAAVTARLMEVIREEEFYPDSLETLRVDEDYFVVYRNRTLLVIQPADTIGTGKTLDEISVLVLNGLNEHLASKSVKFTFMATIRNIGYTMVVVALLILIIWILNKIFRRIYRYADTHRAKLFKSIKINTYEFLTAEREYQVALTLLKILKVGLIVFLFLIALPVIFSIFPTTEGVTRKLIGMIWSPVRNILMAVVNYLPKLVTIIIIYLIFKYLIRFIRFLSMEVERGALVIPGFYPDWSKSTYNIIRLLLYAFMFVIIFPYLPGSESPIFRGVSVFLGVLFSLGSSSVVSNIMAGLVITY
ncbi:MAG: hypothetical protein HGA23_09380, partial [Bacteroidales bacterium]|nr:hypothetical protein [Bacteroidales bacterium]